MGVLEQEYRRRRKNWSFFSSGYIVKLMKWHVDRTKEIGCIDSSAQGMFSQAESQPVTSLLSLVLIIFLLAFRIKPAKYSICLTCQSREGSSMQTT